MKPLLKHIFLKLPISRGKFYIMLGKNKKSRRVKKFLTAQQWEAKPHRRQGSSLLIVLILPTYVPKLTQAQSCSAGLCRSLSPVPPAAQSPRSARSTRLPLLLEQEGRIIKNPLVSNKSNAEPLPWRAGRGAQLRGLSPQRDRAGGRRSGAGRARPLTPATREPAGTSPGDEDPSARRPRRARGAPRGGAALTGFGVRASPCRGRNEPWRRTGRWSEQRRGLRQAAAPNSCALRRPPPTAGG